MTHRERLRRAGILCCHCLRNIAFYRSWYKAKRPYAEEQFWVNANGNFLDIAVLEWCKLFADPKGKHHYKKLVDDPAAFTAQMLSSLGLSVNEFALYVKAMKTYRDKFIAHLDDQRTMNIPNLGTVKKTTKFLYEALLAQESRNDTFHDAPVSASKFYRQHLAEGKAAYRR